MRRRDRGPAVPMDGGRAGGREPFRGRGDSIEDNLYRVSAGIIATLGTSVRPVMREKPKPCP